MYYLRIFFGALFLIAKFFVMATCVMMAIKNTNLMWVSVAIVLLAAIITFMIWLHD